VPFDACLLCLCTHASRVCHEMNDHKVKICWFYIRNKSYNLINAKFTATNMKPEFILVYIESYFIIISDFFMAHNEFDVVCCVEVVMGLSWLGTAPC